MRERATSIALALILATGALAIVPAGALAQEASRGVRVPFTLTGGVMLSERGQAHDPQAGRLTAGFRSVFYPGLRINREWFVYSALQVSSEPFFYYETYYPERRAGDPAAVPGSHLAGREWREKADDTGYGPGNDVFGVQ